MTKAQPSLLELADLMTDAERHLLSQMRDSFSIHPGNQSAVVRHFLRRAEMDLGLLTNPSFDNYFLTPLGKSARAAALRATEHHHD